jgi:methionine-rich copper-binding protein CopC
MRKNGHMRRSFLFLVTLAFGLTISATAFAHGEIESTIPEADSKLGKAPNHLIINFSEAPTKDAVFKVLDGCGRNMIDQAGVQGGTGHIFLASGGEPGKWEVSYKIVSAVDGHPSNGSYGLTVQGKKDCGGSSGGGGNAPNGGGGNAAGDGAPTGNEEDGGSFPVVPVLLGTVGLVALAFLARRAAG